MKSETLIDNDPWEKRKKYEEELKEQLESNKRKNEERRQKELEEEMKFERRFLEQQEKMQREFEAEIAKKKERQATGSGGVEDGQTRVPLVERTSSPPVPALREAVLSKDIIHSWTKSLMRSLIQTSYKTSGKVWSRGERS